MKFQFKTIVVKDEPEVVEAPEQIASVPTAPLPPTPVTLTKEFLFAGRATLLVQNGKGEQFMYRIKSSSEKKTDSRYGGPVNPAAQDRPVYFLNVKAPGGKRWPNGSQSPWRYVGLVDPTTGVVKTTSKSEFTSEDTFYKVGAWIVKIVLSGGSLPAGYRVSSAGKCGKCGGPLTEDSESGSQGFDLACWNTINGMKPLPVAPMTRDDIAVAFGFTAWMEENVG